MKIAILQKVSYEFIGVMFISSTIKKIGHECEVFVSDLEKGHLLENVRKYCPDIIAFSLMSSDYRWFLNIMSLLCQIFPFTPVIVGGAHATTFPELIEDKKIIILKISKPFF